MFGRSTATSATRVLVGQSSTAAASMISRTRSFGVKRVIVGSQALSLMLRAALMSASYRVPAHGQPSFSQ